MNINPIIAETITAAFVSALNNKKIPWKRGWKTRGNFTGTTFKSRSLNVQRSGPYYGINALLLDSLGLELPVWGTTKQWCIALHGTYDKFKKIKKDGEKPMPTVFWSFFYVHKTDKKKAVLSSEQYNNLSSDEQKQYNKLSKLRYDNLYHIGQIFGDEDKIEKIAAKFRKKFAEMDAEIPVVDETAPFSHDLSEQIVSATNITIRHDEQGQACYYPKMDVIKMPLKEQFDGMERYYEVLFHEIAHATGHSSRLNRKGITENSYFGSAVYSFEELVAEIASAFICGHLGIQQDLENSKEYVRGWASKLSSEPKWVIEASGLAVKAAAWVLNHVPATIVAQPQPEFAGEAE